MKWFYLIVTVIDLIILFTSKGEDMIRWGFIVVATILYWILTELYELKILTKEGKFEVKVGLMSAKDLKKEENSDPVI